MVTLNSQTNVAGNNLSKVELKQKFGASKELMKSVSHALEDRTYSASDIDVNKAVEEAIHVASYGYEYGTGWGKQVCHTNLYELDRRLCFVLFCFVCLLGATCRCSG